MKNKEFEKYGIVRKIIAGKGEITFDRIGKFKMNFSIVQFSDGK